MPLTLPQSADIGSLPLGTVLSSTNPADLPALAARTRHILHEHEAALLGVLVGTFISNLIKQHAGGPLTTTKGTRGQIETEQRAIAAARNTGAALHAQAKRIEAEALKASAEAGHIQKEIDNAYLRQEHIFGNILDRSVNLARRQRVDQLNAKADALNAAARELKAQAHGLDAIAEGRPVMSQPRTGVNTLNISATGLQGLAGAGPVAAALEALELTRRAADQELNFVRLQLLAGVPPERVETITLANTGLAELLDAFQRLRRQVENGYARVPVTFGLDAEGNRVAVTGRPPIPGGATLSPELREQFVALLGGVPLDLVTPEELVAASTATGPAKPRVHTLMMNGVDP